MTISYAECSARERIARVFDAGSFHEWLPPSDRLASPHLAMLGIPGAFDDGIAIGRARLDGHEVFVASQEGAFIGGGVGEVHGAKLVGLLRRAARDRPEAVVILAESGGVRLHEANAGLIAVSEAMRALLDARAAGLPVLMLIGGANGCFGGMGLIACCADTIVMSDVARLAMSGPEVIEASNGVEEFDSRDRALVWRTTGGKHRYLTGDCDVLVEDDVAAFRAAALARLVVRKPMTLDALEAEQALLLRRYADTPDDADAVGLWRRLGIASPETVPDLDVAAIVALRSAIVVPDEILMNWSELTDALFERHDVRAKGDLLVGTGTLDGDEVAVVGTTNHAAIGVALALAQARAVLDVVATQPRRAILLLVDTQGQRLRRRDELVGINRAMAHLGRALDLARRQGHRVIGLVYDQALSGGFLTSGLIADTCDALPEAEIRVMRIPAMSRVTKIPESRLEDLSRTNPVFAPGVEHYVAMGGVHALWRGDLRANLRDALANATTLDTRAADGRTRGGRLLAASVVERVMAA